MPMKSYERGVQEVRLQMLEVVAYFCFIITPVIAAFLLIASLVAERERLEIYAEDKSELDDKLAKWREMKRKLSEWKEEEWRKMEERRIAKDQAIASSIKKMIGGPQG